MYLSVTVFVFVFESGTKVRAISGATLRPPGITAHPSQRSLKKPKLAPGSLATESVTRCPPPISFVRQRWPQAGKGLGGITVQRTK